MYEQPLPNFDDVMKIVDKLFADLAINPRVELAEEILRLTNVMGDEENLGDLSDEELQEALRKAAAIVVKSEELAGEIARMYGKDNLI